MARTAIIQGAGKAMMVEFESPTNCDVCGEVWDAAGWVSCPRCQVTETKARVAELVADVERRRERERRLESERDHARQASTIDRARVAELEAAVRTLVGHHSGACCTFDAFNKVIVTQTSCKCPEPIHLARILVGEWRTPSVSAASTDQQVDSERKLYSCSGCGRVGTATGDIQHETTCNPRGRWYAVAGVAAPRPSEARCSGCGRGSDSIERCVLCKRGIRPNDAPRTSPEKCQRWLDTFGGSANAAQHLADLLDLTAADAIKNAPRVDKATAKQVTGPISNPPAMLEQIAKDLVEDGDYNLVAQLRDIIETHKQEESEWNRMHSEQCRINTELKAKVAELEATRTDYPTSDELLDALRRVKKWADDYADHFPGDFEWQELDAILSDFDLRRDACTANPTSKETK
jgi:hypothetical protein